MKIKDFIGKTVIRASNQKCYRLYEITSPVIEIIEQEPDSNGVCRVVRYHTIYGDPFANGDLSFENKNLSEVFAAVYDAHCRSNDGFVEEYGYWMRRD